MRRESCSAKLNCTPAATTQGSITLHLGPPFLPPSFAPTLLPCSSLGGRHRHHSRRLVHELQPREAADETAEAMAAGSRGGEALAATTAGQLLDLVGIKRR